MTGGKVRELNERAALRIALQGARDYTLALYAHLDQAQRQFPYLRVVNPPVWELAHVGWFQEFWCLRYRDGREPLPSRLPDADPRLNSAIMPHAKRWELPELTWEVMQHYLTAELEDTLNALEHADTERLYFFRLALFHEDMHGEALLMSLQTLGLPAPAPYRQAVEHPAIRSAIREIEFAGGRFVQGSRPGADFVFDNEERAHEVNVSPFALAAATVTNGEYAKFIDAGSYERAELWSEAGWIWRGEAGLKAPRDWRKEGGRWTMRRFDGWQPLAEDEPAMHVNAHEAEAYCRYVGRRLPTESEWEFAARAGLPEDADRLPWGHEPLAAGEVNLGGTCAGPVASTALPGANSASGLRQMLGNVWEWTSTRFAPYPGFVPGHYSEYSQPWFYDHRVLRGGCFATQPRLVHNRWRNFYMPHRNDVFAGFRTARSL